MSTTKRVHHLSIYSLLVGTIALLSGCGDRESPPLGKVTGVVSANGEPLPNVLVIFEPAGGRASVAKTSAEGQYVLHYSSTRKGAELGTHSVRIESQEGEETSSNGPQISSEFNSKSNLKANVVAGSNTFDFDVTLTAPRKTNRRSRGGEVSGE